MSLYLESGYVDMRSIILNRYPWCIVWGGRGTGKTYGALQTLYDEGIPFAYMRRTQAQTNMINKPDFSPFRDLMLDRDDVHVATQPVAPNIAGFFRCAQDEDGNWVPSGDPIGVTLALSTVASIRGFSGRWIKCIVYDEFIPESHERALKDEFSALANAYETINRNRELQGQPPLKLVLLSNSNEINNPIFEGLDLVKRVRLMRQRKQEVCCLDQRGIALYGLDQSPVSARKAQTALYRITHGSKFERMAISNTYAQDTGSRIESRSLAGYAPMCAIGKLCLYRAKDGGDYYGCRHISGSPAQYQESKPDTKRFRTDYAWLWTEYLRNRIVFEDDTSEHLMRKVFLPD